MVSQKIAAGREVIISSSMEQNTKVPMRSEFAVYRDVIHNIQVLAVSN